MCFNLNVPLIYLTIFIQVMTYVATIHLDKEDAEKIEKIRNLWPVPKSKIIKFAWPRCPICGGLLVQKFASSNLVCVGCKREYKLIEVGNNG